MQVHSIIVGQGLAGTLLAYQLLKRGKQVVVIDLERDNSSSKVAAGLFNPITGHRLVKTWMVEQLFPHLESTYKELELLLQERLLYSIPIVRPLESLAHQNEWIAQSAEPGFKAWVEVEKTPEALHHHFSFPFGILKTVRSGYLEVPALLKAFRMFLSKQQLLRESQVNYSEITISSNSVRYQDIEAAQIIFCEGSYSNVNPYFNYLPLHGTKGEILEIAIETYLVDWIVNKGAWVIPKNGRQVVGSNYEWNYENANPSTQGREEIQTKLEKVLKSPYKTLSHRAGIRPTVKDHRPLIGKHPEVPNVYIFNGMGTKGVSLAPYFSDHFAQHLTEERNLMAEVDIQRFDYLYRSK